MKEAIEWLSQLDEPYKGQALDNCTNLPTSMQNEDSDSLHDALSKCFVWSSSPEGYKYWNDLWIKLYKSRKKI